MRFWNFVKQISILPLSFESSMASHSALQLRVLSFNIRYATTSPDANEKPWSQRYPHVLNQLQHETRFLDGTASAGSTQPPGASVICLQEVLHTQLLDLLNGLNGLPPSTNSSDVPPDGPVWAHVGVGRDDGKTAGEYSPIIYPVNIFRVLYFKTVWLSPTPDVPSKGWDAGSIRILTVAVLEYKSTGKRVLAGATHLDNAGSESRKHSIDIIISTLTDVEEEWAVKGVLPIFLAGDFNSSPTQEAYQRMVKEGYMYDLQTLVRPERRYGNENTYTSFDPDKERENVSRIDFIWLGPKHGVHNSSAVAGSSAQKRSWAVDGYSVLPNVFDDGVYLSDHRCVVGDLRLHA